VILPMFPLGTVLLPGQLLPLHVFEDRYRQMMAMVQETDPPIFGIVLIERGSEVGGHDVRSTVGTCARVLRVHELDEGRLAVIVGGTNRIAVEEWLPDDPFPQARVVDFPDVVSHDDADAVRCVHTLHRRVAAIATEMGIGTFTVTAIDQLDPSLAAFTMITESPLGPLDRQQLLEATALSERIARFAAMLQEQEQTLLMEIRRSAD